MFGCLRKTTLFPLPLQPHLHTVIHQLNDWYDHKHPVLSANVNGSGTLFTTEFAVGQSIYDASGTNLIGTIASISSPTQLTFAANAFVGSSGASYTGPHHGIGKPGPT